MKKSLFLKATLSFSIVLLLSFSLATKLDNINTSTANVLQVQGLYIFTDCTPATEYFYLGTVTPKIVQIGQSVTGSDGLTVCELSYTQLRDDLIKQTKKKYKDGTAIIIFPAENKADVIKFR